MSRRTTISTSSPPRLRAVGEPMRGLPVKDISIGQMLDGLFAITRDFDMPTQPHLLLLQKTMVMEEGVATALDPDINMWETAEPFLTEWVRSELGPRRGFADEIDPHRAACCARSPRPDPPHRRIIIPPPGAAPPSPPLREHRRCGCGRIALGAWTCARCRGCARRRPAGVPRRRPVPLPGGGVAARLA